jgi:hypothetical protein
MDEQGTEGLGVIHSYTRQEAIEDGQLFDVSESHEAKEAGFRVPVCITAGVQTLVQVPDSLSGCQDYSGRLWDTLYMAALELKRTSSDKHLVPFKVIYQIALRQSKTVTLWLCFNEHEGFIITLPEEY